MEIDWTRVAAPQDDGYDTDVILHLAGTTTNRFRPRPHVRRALDGAPTIFDGAVAVRYLRDQGPRHPICVNAPLDHPNIAASVELVRRWPVIFRQFQRVIDTFHPLTDTSIPPERRATSLGSSSHFEQQWFGTLYATVDEPIGLAQAFVHEMSHNKLCGLGLYLETTAVGLIANRPDELYESPVRKDRPRPMTAVFHAQYSFIHVTALDAALIGSTDDELELRKLLILLERNVRRMEEGDAELKRHLRVDADGDRFFDGFFRWSNEVLRRGNALLERYRALLPVRR